VADPYLYPDTSVLRNRRGILDKDQLAEAEAYFVEARLAAIDDAPIEQSFAPGHLCSIHHWLFGDLYEWAGAYRRTDFSKGQTQFWDFNGIEARLTKVLGRLREGPLLAEVVDDDVFLRGLADLYLDLNHLHPFREGNGRTQRIFLGHVAGISGRSLDWTQVRKEENDKACASATVHQNPAPLRVLLERSVVSAEDDPLLPSARLIYSFREATALARAAARGRPEQARDAERDQHLVLQAIEAGLELTRLSEETREAADLRHGYVKALHEGGRSMEWIATRLGVSKSAVQKILDRP
jgi:cell filamentation protein